METIEISGAVQDWLPAAIGHCEGLGDERLLDYCMDSVAQRIQDWVDFYIEPSSNMDTCKLIQKPWRNHCYEALGFLVGYCAPIKGWTTLTACDPIEEEYAQNCVTGVLSGLQAHNTTISRPYENQFRRHMAEAVNGGHARQEVSHESISN